MGDLVPFQQTASVAEFADIIIDSAILMVDGTQLTLSRGGWTFDPGEEWEDYPFPGRTMNTVGTRSLVRMNPTIKGTALLTGEDQITAFRPDGTWGDHATITGARTFTPNELRTYLTDADYLENVVVIWKRQRGDYIAVEFPFAVCGQWGIGAQDNDEGTQQVVFEAVKDATSPPYRVRTVPTPEDADAPPVEPPDPSDLPEDEDLGNIILDLNAFTLLDLGRADNSFIEAGAGWPDDTGRQVDIVPYTTSGTQTPPVFKTDGFPGDLPSVRVAGLKEGLKFTPPAVDSCTYYYVVGNLTGAGSNGNAQGLNAPITYAPGVGGSNFWLSLRADGKLQSAVNTSVFGFTGSLGSGDYDGTGPHIIRMAWNRGLKRWKVFVDGTLDLARGQPPVSIGNYWNLIARVYLGNGSFEPTNKLFADFGRVVVYDKGDGPHEEEGLNTAELALQAVWGTP